MKMDRRDFADYERGSEEAARQLQEEQERQQQHQHPHHHQQLQQWQPQLQFLQQPLLENPLSPFPPPPPQQQLLPYPSSLHPQQGQGYDRCLQGYGQNPPLQGFGYEGYGVREPSFAGAAASPMQPPVGYVAASSSQPPRGYVAASSLPGASAFPEPTQVYDVPAPSDPPAFDDHPPLLTEAPLEIPGADPAASSGQSPGVLRRRAPPWTDRESLHLLLSQIPPDNEIDWDTVAIPEGRDLAGAQRVVALARRLVEHGPGALPRPTLSQLAEQETKRWTDKEKLQVLTSLFPDKLTIRPEHHLGRSRKAAVHKIDEARRFARDGPNRNRSAAPEERRRRRAREHHHPGSVVGDDQEGARREGDEGGGEGEGRDDGGGQKRQRTE